MSRPTSVNMSFDMVIKKDFAKYIIDNKANLVRTDDVHDKAKYIYAPALPCSVTDIDKSLKHRFLLKAEGRRVSKLFVVLEVLVSQDNRNVPFSIILESSLIQFLPSNMESYGKLFASFASTSVDNFLFLHFEDSNFQIRTLLLSRQHDIDRLFKEKTFFAIQKPFPTLWIENHNFSLNLSYKVILRESRYPMSELYLVSVEAGIEDKKLRFEKEEYHVLMMEVNFGEHTKNYFIHFHESDREMKKQILDPLQESNSNRLSLDCIQTNTGFSLEDQSVSVQLTEVTSLEDLPRKILICSRFIVEEETDKTLKSLGLRITNNTDNSRVEVSQTEAVLPSLTLTCPFPSCHTPLDNSHQTVIQHFLTHSDFQRVIENQLKRHQAKNSKPSSQCPFKNCQFQSSEPRDLEQHYALSHLVGHIVFLQFSRANSWDTECFSRAGLITQHILTIVQCSHCFEVMTRVQLAIHVKALRAGNTSSSS